MGLAPISSGLKNRSRDTLYSRAKNWSPRPDLHQQPLRSKRSASALGYEGEEAARRLISSSDRPVCFFDLSFGIFHRRKGWLRFVREDKTSRQWKESPLIFLSAGECALMDRCRMGTSGLNERGTVRTKERRGSHPVFMQRSAVNSGVGSNGKGGAARGVAVLRCFHIGWLIPRSVMVTPLGARDCDPAIGAAPIWSRLQNECLRCSAKPENKREIAPAGFAPTSHGV